MKWEAVKLDSIKGQEKGSLVSGPFGSNIGSRFFVDEGVPLIRGNNLSMGKEKFIENGFVFITEDKARELKNCNTRTDDIIFTAAGSLGQVGIIPKTCRFPVYIISNKQIRLRLDTSKAFPLYLYYFLSSRDMRAFIASQNKGSSVPLLTLGIIRNLKVLLPSITIQRKIAAVISAYADLIENNQRRIALLEKMAEELYREWFVRMRFPGHEKVKKIKGVPEGWGMVKLENAFQYTGGGTPSKEVHRYWDGGEINWFTPSDITGADGIFLEGSGEQCTEEGFNNSSAKMFPAYSVMLTSRATIGAVGINLTPACTNQGFITCIPNARYPLPYLYHWIKLAKPHFEILAVGATFAELTKGTFKRIEILTPPEPIVTEFARIVSPLFKAIENHLRANKKLIETRDKLLPRLISGKLSVEKFDIQFPPSMEEATHAA